MEVAELVRQAVRDFWATRERQTRKQGTISGLKDRGGRGAVTGGAQMDGFADLVSELLIEDGIPEVSVYRKRRVDLPGFFRAEKSWDLIVVVQDRLLATIEFKSQVGPSFGNNFNNRSEEAIGSATDFRTAYREGAFAPSSGPWLGYLMLLEDTEGSRNPVRVSESHFSVFREFKEASYIRRYELLLTKLVRERLYDSACLLISNAADGA